ERPAAIGDPGERLLDDDLGLRPRYERVGGDAEGEAPELAARQQLRHRLMPAAALDEVAEALAFGCRQRALGMRDKVRRLELQHVAQQQPGVEAGGVDSGGGETPDGGLQSGAHGRGHAGRAPSSGDFKTERWTPCPAEEPVRPARVRRSSGSETERWTPCPAGKQHPAEASSLPSTGGRAHSPDEKTKLRIGRTHQSPPEFETERSTPCPAEIRSRRRAEARPARRFATAIGFQVRSGYQLGSCIVPIYGVLSTLVKSRARRRGREADNGVVPRIQFYARNLSQELG